MNRRPPTALLLAALTLAAGGCTPPARTPGFVVPSSVAPSTPAFTDVTRGDTASIVKLRRYDARARSAVVEPTIFLDGPAFCRAFRVPETDARCERAWVTEDSRTKVTLPVSPDVRLTTVREGEPECIDDETGAGSCRWDADGVRRRQSEDGDLLVHLTTRDGTVTRIAELYLP